MAVMLAALIMKGIAPGPSLIAEHPDIFWGLVASFIIGNVLLVIWHIPFIRIWVQLLTIPFHLLYPAVMVMICMGVYSIHSSATDVLLLLVFGGLGYGMRLLGFQPAPLLVGLVLGPLMEEHLRRSLIVSRGDFLVFFEKPISAVVLLISLLVLIVTFRKKQVVT